MTIMQLIILFFLFQSYSEYLTTQKREAMSRIKWSFFVKYRKFNYYTVFAYHKAIKMNIIITSHWMET